VGAAKTIACQFNVGKVPVVVADSGNNRMRIMITRKKPECMSPQELQRL
jgi:hypothetical protein